MSYIDGKKLMQELSTMYKTPTSTEDFMTIGYDHAITDVIVTVHKQLTFEAVDVVRCKDCKHWGSTISQADREQCASQGVDLVCNYWETDGLYFEDFCSYAERKETEDAEIQ